MHHSQSPHHQGQRRATPALPGRRHDFKPVQTLHELSRIRNLKPGDLIATGTPAGVGMKVPGKLLLLIADLMPTRKRFELFVKKQANNPRILRPGDTIELNIATEDGIIDLGTQRNRIVAGKPS